MVEYVNLQVWTADNLRLSGHLFHGGDVCVLFVPGMAETFSTSFYAQTLAQRLPSAGFSFLFPQTRGHGEVTLFPSSGVSKDNGWVKAELGTRYELFGDSVKDLDAWMDRLAQLGYTNIILAGHSLGANKALNYMNQRPASLVSGLALLSPPDLPGLLRLYQPDHGELLRSAIAKMKEDPRALLPMIWGQYHLSAQTFLSLFQEGSPADNLPLLRNPEVFDALSKVHVPLLALSGEYDDTSINGLMEDLRTIGSKALKAPSFSLTLLEGANHMYENREESLSEVLMQWLDSL